MNLIDFKTRVYTTLHSTNMQTFDYINDEYVSDGYVSDEYADPAHCTFGRLSRTSLELIQAQLAVGHFCRDQGTFEADELASMLKDRPMTMSILMKQVDSNMLPVEGDVDPSTLAKAIHSRCDGRLNHLNRLVDSDEFVVFSPLSVDPKPWGPMLRPYTPSCYPDKPLGSEAHYAKLFSSLQADLLAEQPCRKRRAECEFLEFSDHGDFKALSNSHRQSVQVHGIEYASGEHALQGIKFLWAASRLHENSTGRDPRVEILRLHAAEFASPSKYNTPRRAYKAGAKEAFQLDADEIRNWNKQAVDAQLDVCKAKLTDDKVLQVLEDAGQGSCILYRPGRSSYSKCHGLGEAWNWLLTRKRAVDEIVDEPGISTRSYVV